MNNFIDIKRLYYRILKLRVERDELEFSRDQWRSMYEQTLTIAVQATDHE